MTLHSTHKASDIRSLAQFHFIAGLPRSGVSVLSAILNQNPRCRAGVGSPAEALFRHTAERLATGGQDAGLLDDGQKIAFLRATTDSVYHERPFEAVVFDANLNWLRHVETLVRLYPLCRFILCVRNPSAIVNAILVNAADNTALAARISVESGPDSDLATAIGLLREVLSSYLAERVLILDYDRLTDDPEEAMDVVYDFLRLPGFHHDFTEIGGNIRGIDGPVIRSARATVLPTRELLQLSGRAFWRNLKRTSATMLLGRAR